MIINIANNFHIYSIYSITYNKNYPMCPNCRFSVIFTHTHTNFRYVKFNASILLELATLKFSVQTLKTNFCSLCLQKLLSQLLRCVETFSTNLFLVNAVNPIHM